MSFNCPIHGPYVPTPGSTGAICPSCNSASAVVQPVAAPDRYCPTCGKRRDPVSTRDQEATDD